MICPRWVAVETQPIAIEDVDRVPRRRARPARGRRADLRDRRPGPGDLRRPHARVRASARPAALADPGAGADAAALEPLARPRDAALRARRPQARRQPPQPDGRPRPLGARGLFRVAPVAACATRSRRRSPTRTASFAETRWSDASPRLGLTERYGGELRRDAPRRLARGRRRRHRRPRRSRPIRRIGGDDRLVLRRLAVAPARARSTSLCGGVGLRRGRRRPRRARASATPLDFWRVEAIEPGPPPAPARRDEGSGPGLAPVRDDAGRPAAAEIRQTAIFDAVGLVGLAYWYALYPLHRFVFAGMLRAIAARAAGGTIRA